MVQRLIYGAANALVFNKLFFPLSNPALGTSAAFGTYGVGFLDRPLGAAIFGHFGDRVGRKPQGHARDEVVIMGSALSWSGSLIARHDNDSGALQYYCDGVSNCRRSRRFGGQSDALHRAPNNGHHWRATQKTQSRGCGLVCGSRAKDCRVEQAISGTKTGLVHELESLAMFKIPAYDPVGIAMMGFGVLLVLALTFAF